MMKKTILNVMLRVSTDVFIASSLTLLFFNLLVLRGITVERTLYEAYFFILFIAGIMIVTTAYAFVVHLVIGYILSERRNVKRRRELRHEFAAKDYVKTEGKSEDNRRMEKI